MVYGKVIYRNVIMHILRECVTGGIAASGACLFSNPLEVVKTRMQLQGELQVRGTYAVHYRNVFHAFYMIAKVDGVTGLQKGLVPGLIYQFFMNGIRLGSYQMMTNMKLTNNKDGDISFVKCLLGGAVSGAVGAFSASPMYMMKTQLQAQANASIAVGAQHNIASLSSALASIYRKNGFLGLWRGSSASMLRVTTGSAVQLSSFSSAKEYILKKEWFDSQSIMVPLSASMLSGVVLAVAMTPFDVVATRIYNQKVDEHGRGLMYNSIFDVFKKVMKAEGLMGFYKGLGAHYFRIGPHTLLCLVFWDKLKTLMN